MDIVGSTLQTLEKALDLRMINQRVITANLANVDTPGYVAQRMDFVGLSSVGGIWTLSLSAMVSFMSSHGNSTRFEPSLCTRTR